MSELVPIHELAATQSPSDKGYVDWRYPLSEQASRAIGLDLESVRQLQEFSGLGSIAIVGYRGKTAEQVPVVGGLLGGNTLAASQVITVGRADADRGTLLSDNEYLPGVYRWPGALLELNSTNIEKRTGEAILLHTDGAEALSAELDRAVRHGLHRAAFQRLLGDPYSSTAIRRFNQLEAGLQTVLLPFGIATGSVPVLAGLSLLYGSRFAIEELWTRSSPNPPPPGQRRWSIFPGDVQPDRYIAAALYNLTHTLLRPIDARAH